MVAVDQFEDYSDNRYTFIQLLDRALRSVSWEILALLTIDMAVIAFSMKSFQIYISLYISILIIHIFGWMLYKTVTERILLALGFVCICIQYIDKKVARHGSARKLEGSASVAS